MMLEGATMCKLVLSPCSVLFVIGMQMDTCYRDVIALALVKKNRVKVWKAGRSRSHLSSQAAYKASTACLCRWP